MIITRTPLRISFLGGGTDFPDFYKKHGGCVVTTAIDKYVYVIVKERFDKQIYVNYSIKEIVDRVGELKHELVREAMRKVGIKDGIEISFQSDVPSAGSGLGSSSTVTVGTLNALYQYTGRAVDAEKLAKEACEIEIKILGKPIGVQDQYIAAYGGVRFLDLPAGRQGLKNPWGVRVEDLHLSEETLDDLKSYMMVFFTGRTRQAGSILAEQKENIKNKNEVLKKMAGQAREARELLIKGKIDQLGKLLDQGWQLKRQLASRISDPEIDKLYAAAKRAGAIGGKISGAGGGGFLTLFVPTGKREAVRKSLKGLKEMPIGLSRDGSKVIFNIR
ncbi:MAG: GHMP kinase [Patescibacteria group bacterium]